MKRMTIINTIQSKVQEIKGNTVILREEDFIDYRGAGLNSVELMIMIVFLEEYFDFESDDEKLKIDELVLLKDLIDMVMTHLTKED